MNTIQDKELGEIILIPNKRAKTIIVRRKDGCFRLTHPADATLSFIKKTIEDMRPRLLKMAEREVLKLRFVCGTEFETFSFKLQLSESMSAGNYYMSLKNGILSISCPSGTDYNDSQVQETIRNLIEKAFRYEATRLFPAKVEYFAHKFGFTFTGVKINKSKSRWGSCSVKKSINLSYYLMFLPEYLIDFIVLHELCHTREMNHGERFWKLLDEVSGGKAKQYTKELKSYKTGW